MFDDTLVVDKYAGWHATGYPPGSFCNGDGCLSNNAPLQPFDETAQHRCERGADSSSSSSIPGCVADNCHNSSDPSKAPINSCWYSKDGECDEPRYCVVGTDCADCGLWHLRTIRPGTVALESTQLPVLQLRAVVRHEYIALHQLQINGVDTHGWFTCEEQASSSCGFVWGSIDKVG